MSQAADVLAAFRDVVGSEHVLVADDARTLASQDVYRAGSLPLAVLRPQSTADVAQLVRLARAERLAVHVRGGGMSYTDAYLPQHTHSIVLDMRGLDRVREIVADDHIVTAEAGCTWAALDAAVAPRGLRARFWGPMSGALATLGGGFSQGAATFGSARHGSSASTALDFEVVLGDGSILHTGRAGNAARPAFFRPYGPDLTGLYTGDAGALGIKTAVTLQLEQRPGAQGSLSFAFKDFTTMRAGVSAVARSGLATEIFGLETALARLAAGDAALVQDATTLWQMMRAQRTPLAALRQAWRTTRAGRTFLAESECIANVLCEARDAARLTLTLDDVRRVLQPYGVEVANTMAAVVQATPFPPPMVVGPRGMRLLPLHVILPHSAVDGFHAAFEILRAHEQVQLERHRVQMFVVFAGVGESALLYEPVIYWEDEWLPLHHAVLPAALRTQLAPAPANPEGRRYVESLRVRLIELMHAHGGVHLQIGRAYPYLRERTPAFTELVKALKHAVDPDGLLNPGALGL
jgi:FAD/FMN-containing dehydrogenase